MTVLEQDVLELKELYLKKNLKKRVQECAYLPCDKEAVKDINTVLKKYKEAEVKHICIDDNNYLLVVFEYSV